MSSSLESIELILYQVVIIVVIIGLLIYTWLLCRSCRRNKVGELATLLWRQLVHANHVLWRRTTEYSPLDIKIDELVAHRRADRFQRIMAMCAHLFGIQLAIFLFQNVTKFHVAYDDRISESLYLSNALGFSVLFALSLVVMGCPGIVNTRFARIAFFLQCVSQVFRTILGFQSCSSQSMHIRVFPGLLFSRFIGGLLVSDVKFTSICGLVVSCTSAIASVLYPVPGDENAKMGILVNHMFWGFTMVVFWAGFEYSTWMQVKYELEAKTSSQVMSTVRQLLASLCDAVTIIRGPEYKITQPAPKLAALLLRQDSLGALDGTSFLDLVDEADKERVVNFLLRKSVKYSEDSRIEPVALIPATLRAQGGISVRAQLFHAHFIDIYDENVHMLGICEVGDTGVAVPDCAVQTELEASRTSRRNTRSDNSSENSSAISMSLQCLHDVRIEIDVLSFEILDYSKGFGDLLARLFLGKSFLDLLDDKPVFVKFAQQHAQQNFHGGSASSSQSSRMVKLRCGKGALRTVCTIESNMDDCEMGEGEGLPFEMPVCLTLSSFQRVRQRSSRRQTANTLLCRTPPAVENQTSRSIENQTARSALKPTEIITL